MTFKLPVSDELYLSILLSVDGQQFINSYENDDEILGFCPALEKANISFHDSAIFFRHDNEDYYLLLYYPLTDTFLLGNRILSFQEADKLIPFVDAIREKNGTGRRIFERWNGDLLSRYIFPADKYSNTKCYHNDLDKLRRIGFYNKQELPIIEAALPPIREWRLLTDGRGEMDKL